MVQHTTEYGRPKHSAGMILAADTSPHACSYIVLPSHPFPTSLKRAYWFIADGQGGANIFPPHIVCWIFLGFYWNMDNRVARLPLHLPAGALRFCLRTPLPLFVDMLLMYYSVPDFLVDITTLPHVPPHSGVCSHTHLPSCRAAALLFCSFNLRFYDLVYALVHSRLPINT